MLRSATERQVKPLQGQTVHIAPSLPPVTTLVFFSSSAVIHICILNRSYQVFFILPPPPNYHIFLHTRVPRRNRPRPPYNAVCDNESWHVRPRDAAVHVGLFSRRASVESPYYRRPPRERVSSPCTEHTHTTTTTTTTTADRLQTSYLYATHVRDDNTSSCNSSRSSIVAVLPRGLEHGIRNM